MLNLQFDEGDLYIFGGEIGTQLEKFFDKKNLDRLFQGNSTD